MKESEFVISINQDSDAPIVDESDILIKGKIEDVLPLLINELKKYKEKMQISTGDKIIMEKFDVAIIGGGSAGLAALKHLSNLGKQAILIEGWKENRNQKYIWWYTIL